MQSASLLKLLVEELISQFNNALSYVEKYLAKEELPAEYLIASIATIESLFGILKKTKLNADEYLCITSTCTELLKIFDFKTDLNAETLTGLSHRVIQDGHSFISINEKLNIQNIQTLRQIIELFLYDIQKGSIAQSLSAHTIN